LNGTDYEVQKCQSLTDQTPMSVVLIQKFKTSLKMVLIPPRTITHKFNVLYLIDETTHPGTGRQH
jgi:hypothetical protein